MQRLPRVSRKYVSLRFCILLGVSSLAAVVAFAISKAWFREFETFLGSRIGDTEDAVAKRVPPWRCDKIQTAEYVAEMRWCEGSGTPPKHVAGLPPRYILVKVQALFYRDRLVLVSEDFSCRLDPTLLTFCQELLTTRDVELVLMLLQRWKAPSMISTGTLSSVMWTNLRGHTLLYESWTEWPDNANGQVQHILLGLLDTRRLYRLTAFDPTVAESLEKILIPGMMGGGGVGIMVESWSPSTRLRARGATRSRGPWA
jgi:hypothetical protein